MVSPAEKFSVIGVHRTFLPKGSLINKKLTQAEPKHCMGFLEQLYCLSFRVGLRSQDRKFFARYYSDKNLKIQISLASLLPSVNSSICFRNYTNTWHNLSNEYQRDSNCYPTNLWSSLDLFLLHCLAKERANRAIFDSLNIWSHLSSLRTVTSWQSHYT